MASLLKALLVSKGNEHYQFLLSTVRVWGWKEQPKSKLIWSAACSRGSSATSRHFLFLPVLGAPTLLDHVGIAGYRIPDFIPTVLRGQSWMVKPVFWGENFSGSVHQGLKCLANERSVFSHSHPPSQSRARKRLALLVTLHSPVRPHVLLWLLLFS